MADSSDIPSPPDRRRKQTIMSQGHPEFHDISLQTGTVHSDESEVQAAHTSEDNDVNDDVFEEKQQYKTNTHSNENNNRILEADNTVANDKSNVGFCNSDVSDIVYDDTKPKRLTQPRTLKLDLENPNTHALRDSISVLISPDEPDTGSPTRRRHKQLQSVKSEPTIVSHNQPIETEAVYIRRPERRSRPETVADNKTIQTVKRPRYEQSPERSRRKVSSPVQRLMVKNSHSAAAAAANSKDRKSSSEARLVMGRDRTYIYIPPRRKISSDARLEHRLIEEQLILPAKPKRKVSFDTTALINGNRVMQLNDELIVREEPEPLVEVTKYCSNEREHLSSSSHNSKCYLPRVILTTEEDEWSEKADKDIRCALGNNSEFSEDGEVGNASGCDNKAYIHADEEHERSIPPVSCPVSGASVKRLSPIADKIYSNIEEPAAILNTKLEEIDHLTVSKKISSCSLPSNIGRRRTSLYDYQSPPKSILKKREDAESIASEDSMAGRSINVRKDSIALFMDQNGSVSLQDVRKQYSHRIRCFGKDDIKQIWVHRKLLVEKYKLHLLVLTLFLLTFTFVIVGLHFHSEHHRKLATFQKVFFDAKLRILTLSDIYNQDTLRGNLGLGIPSWKMPTHCYANYKKILDKTCLKWKEHGQLDIFYFIQNNIQCYNITWTLLPGITAYDCYDIGGSNWYGPLNMTTSQWPIRSKQFTFTVSKSKHHGSGTFSSVVEYYWLSSRGEAVVVDSNFPLEISWNKKRRGAFCAIGKPFGQFNSEIEPRKFRYAVCNGMDIQATHALIRERFYPAVTKLPDRGFLENPHWSTVSDSDTFYLNDSVVKSVAQSISKNQLSCSTIEIDGKWEKNFGDILFDNNAFENMTDLLLYIAKAECDISLNIYPFFSFQSVNFVEGMHRDYFVKDTGGSVPALLKWEHGVGAMLDVSNPAARGWYISKIRHIASEYNIDTFRLVYGSSSWIPNKPVFHINGISPTKVKLMFSDLISSLGNVVVESTSQSQHISTLVGIPSSVVPAGDKSCLRNIIPDVLNLGLMGYPFVLSDGFSSIGKHADGDFILPSRDLFIRWMQLSTFFPAIRYTVKPWSYDTKVIESSRNLTKFHSKIVLDTIFNAGDDILKGAPIIQPMWWNRSNDKNTFLIDDQFVLADRYLVAPILCECQLDQDEAERDIYVPEGVWRDMSHDRVIIGPRWIRRYKAAQFDIPFFEKMPQYGD